MHLYMSEMTAPRPCAMTRIKSCLKISPPQSPGGQCNHKRKCVAFCEDGSEQVFPADEWDRTPTEVAQKLSYQDILELKEIQRSLPRANQQHDPFSRMPQSHLLSAVPIGLLPLLPDHEPNNGSSKGSSVSPSPVLPLSPSPSRPSSPPRSRSSSTSSIASNITDVTRGRPRPKFSFVPLLDAPPDPPEPKTFAEFEAMLEEELGLSTPSLTNASLDSPSTRASSPEPTSYFDLPGHSQSSPRHSPPPSPLSSIPDTPHDDHSIRPFNLGAPLLIHTPNQESVRHQTYTRKHGSTQGIPSSSVRRSALSDSEPDPSPCSPDGPFFSFERERNPPPTKGLDTQTRTQSSPPRRAKDLDPPSPILAPFCVSMKRGVAGTEQRSSSMMIVPLNG